MLGVHGACSRASQPLTNIPRVRSSHKLRRSFDEAQRKRDLNVHRTRNRLDCHQYFHAVSIPSALADRVGETLTPSTVAERRLGRGLVLKIMVGDATSCHWQTLG